MARILIAEPDRATRHNLFDILTDHGFSVIAAADGPAALNLITRYRPDLAVIAYQLPPAGGLDLCRLLADDPTSADLPVIITANGNQMPDLCTLLPDNARCLSAPYLTEELAYRIYTATAQHHDHP